MDKYISSKYGSTGRRIHVTMHRACLLPHWLVHHQGIDQFLHFLGR